MDFITAALTLLGPLFMGYACVRAGILRRRWSKPIQRTSVLLLAPPVTFLSMWALDATLADMAGMPLIALVLCLSSMFIAYIIARALRLPRPGTGAFVVSAGWSNTFLLGGYIAFILFGQQGFALVALYNMLNPLLTYVIGFAVASYFSPARRSVSIRSTVIDSMRDPVTFVPTIGLFLGLAVNLSGIEPGSWMDTVSTYMVPIFTVISMFAVGMSMTFGHTRAYLRPILLQSAIKYLVWPAITLALIFILRGNLLHDPVMFRVLLLMSIMPVAMQAMMLANLFDLDIDMVNAAWLTTNLFSLLTVPLILYVARL